MTSSGETLQGSGRIGTARPHNVSAILEASTNTSYGVAAGTAAVTQMDRVTCNTSAEATKLTSTASHWPATEQTARWFGFPVDGRPPEAEGFTGGTQRTGGPLLIQ